MVAGWRSHEAANGESLADLQQRAWEVIEGLLEKHKTNLEPNKDAAAVVVSHYFVTLTIILKALNLPLDCLTKFKLDLGGVSILEFRDYGARLVTFNVTSY